MNKQNPPCTGAQAAARMHIGWNLGNTLDSFAPDKGLAAETAWFNPPVTRQVLQAVADAGFDVIRIPVTWSGHFGAAPGYKLEEAWLERVEQVIRWAMELDVYVILDMHHDGSAMPSPHAWLVPDAAHIEGVLPVFTALWKQLAERFGAYGDKLIFEDMNEPHCGSDWVGNPERYQAVNRLNDAFVRTVRASGGINQTRKLLLPTYAASPKQAAIDALVLPEDPCLLASVHAYIPTEFCFPAREVNWAAPRTQWGTPADHAQLTDLFDRLAKRFPEQGIPLLLGEFAAVSKPDDAQRLAWAEYYVREAARRGIRCLWWDDTSGREECMGLLDRNTCQWRYPELVQTLIRAAYA